MHNALTVARRQLDAQLPTLQLRLRDVADENAQLRQLMDNQTDDATLHIPEQTDRNTRIRELATQGVSHEEIGRAFGITRQRVSQIIRQQ
ncbi:MAG: hypothetical protein HC914_19940 [Chloroflexaceae bacterium]|nr:hypothetical protein [Chloroflexaceae bacterium]